MLRTFALIPFLFLVLGPADEDEAVKKDLKLMEGTWVIASMEADGEQVPLNRLEGTVLTIKDDVYSVKTKQEKSDCKLKLDPSKKPKHVDMTFLDGANKDKTAEGIYEIDKETFKICRALTPGQARPDQFGTWAKTGMFVITWKRQ